MKVPWEASTPVGDGSDVPNVPTPEGAALGLLLARFADEEEAKERVLFPAMLPRCNDCAFRAGTIPNQCPPTLMTALKCIIEGYPFFCHKGNEDGSDPKRLCAGATVLMTTDAKTALAICIAKATKQ